MDNIIKSLCVIPTRGGSVGVKDKNIRDLCGQPLIYYCLDAAQNNFTEVIVASDSQDILDVAKQHSSYPETSKRLSEKTAVDMVCSVAKSKLYEKFDQIYWILPPYVMIKNETVNKFVKSFNQLITLDLAYTSIIAVTEVDFPPTLSLSNDNKCLIPYLDHENFHKKNTRRQDHYFPLRPTGLYGAKFEDFIKCQHFFTDYIYPFYIDKIEAHDIDNEDDFWIAEAIIWRKKDS